MWQGLTPIGILMLTVFLVGCQFAPTGRCDCEYGSSPVKRRVVWRQRYPLPVKDIPIPDAQITMVSGQTKFMWEGATNAKPLILRTDADGVFDGSLGAYGDDVFMIMITAEGCRPYITGGLRSVFANGGDVFLECKGRVPLSETAEPTAESNH